MIRGINKCTHHVHHSPTPFLKLGYLGVVKAKSRHFSILLTFLETAEGRAVVFNPRGLFTFKNQVVNEETMRIPIK